MCTCYSMYTDLIDVDIILDVVYVNKLYNKYN